MYLVIINDTYIFCYDNPREHGFSGEVIEVWFQENLTAFDWPDGSSTKVPCIGRIGDNEYREFCSREQLESCGYEFLTDDYGVLQADYKESLC